MVAVLLLLLLLAVPVAAQAPVRDPDPLRSPAASFPLAVRCAAPEIDGEALRAQLALELAVPVALQDAPAAAHLAVECETIERVRVTFTRASLAAQAGAVEQPPLERVVDLSSTREHALPTLALVLANMVRDDGAELLAELERAQRARASGATPAPTPARRAAAAAKPAPIVRGCSDHGLEPTIAGADFVPYLGTSSWHGTRVERALSLNLAGITGAVRGFELSAALSLDDRALCGVQLAGGANVVGGPAQGVQLAPVNVVQGRVDGIQIAVVNAARGHLAGYQAGALNLALEAVDGAQLGVTNISAGAVAGLQLGVLDVADGAVHGAQIGLLNYSSGHVRGAQIGLLNIAPSADAALGFLSVLWKGRTQLDTWISDAGIFSVAVVHGGPVVHNTFGIGFTGRSVTDVDGDVQTNAEVLSFVPAYGIGVRVIEQQKLFTDVDALAQLMVTQDPFGGGADLSTIVQLRVPIGYRLSRTVALFASPALSVSIAKVNDPLVAEPVFYDGIRLTNENASERVALWPGVSLGARFF
jgi:hypothetical protein